MRKLISCSFFLATIVCACLSSGCTIGPAATGSFDRTMNISGPVQLDLHNGSGRVEIHAGQPGQVRIHADYSVWVLIWSDGHSQDQELQAHPPVEQQGNVVRVGSQDESFNRVQINYTIYVPTETEVRAQVGSGSLEVTGVQGPATLHTGSGHIDGLDIHGDTEADTGSGSITLSSVSGRVTATTGSGRIELNGIDGEIRTSTGSGSVHISRSAGRINAKTSSGSIDSDGAAADLRLSTGSGSVRVQGNPTSGSYWEVRTGSGGVTLDVPSDASFRLHALARSGRIESDLPIVMEEQMGRREVRGRIGSGSASVDLQAGSGSIHIR